MVQEDSDRWRSCENDVVLTLFDWSSPCLERDRCCCCCCCWRFWLLSCFFCLTFCLGWEEFWLLLLDVELVVSLLNSSLFWMIEVVVCPLALLWLFRVFWKSLIREGDDRLEGMFDVVWLIVWLLESDW